MARHRRPARVRAVVTAVRGLPPGRRLAAGLALASALAATGLTATVAPAAPAAPDRTGESSSTAQIPGDRWTVHGNPP